MESTPGKGSEFSFEFAFPFSADSIAAEKSNPELPAESALLSGLRVLLVEDNEYNQILARTYLERNAAVVEIAGNGLIALQVLEQQSFDVILMDIQMPGIDGLETTEKIRNAMCLNFPVIGCSAHAMETEKIRCLQAGMNDYITKPYSEQDLVGAILRTIQNSYKQME